MDAEGSVLPQLPQPSAPFRGPSEEPHVASAPAVLEVVLALSCCFFLTWKRSSMSGTWATWRVTACVLEGEEDVHLVHRRVYVGFRRQGVQPSAL